MRGGSPLSMSGPDCPRSDGGLESSPRFNLVGRTIGSMTVHGVRHSMLTLTSTALGGGVLSVAYVMNLCGVALGCVMLMIGAFLAFIGTKALMEMSTATGCSTYAALFSHCAGPRAGPFLDTMLFIYGSGSVVGYMVFIGDFIPAIVSLMLPDAPAWVKDPRGLVRTLAIVGCSVLMIPLVLPRDLSALRHISPVSLMALVYMAVVVSIRCPANYHANLGQDGFGDVRFVKPSAHFFEAFALCVFAFNCHLNVVPVVETLVRPTRARIIKVSARVNIVQLCFYSLIGVTGYLSFLGNTRSDILNNYDPEDGLVAAGRLMLTFTMMVAIPVNLNPTVKSALQIKDYFNGIQVPMASPRPNSNGEPPRNDAFRISVSVFVLFFAAMLAVAVPNVGTVLSLLGATVATAMMLVIPAYCMGIVLPKTWRRQVQEAVLYFFAAVSVASVPFTVLESVGAIARP